MIRRITLLLMTLLALAGTAWATGICDCNSTCADTCGAAWEDCVSQGRPLSQCNAERNYCLAICNN